MERDHVACLKVARNHQQTAGELLFEVFDGTEGCASASGALRGAHGAVFP
jgi:hypothetical protein